MTVEWKARPTVYNGIQMRSRLEARFAAMLDQETSALGSWSYEARAYANQSAQYLPDFEFEGSTYRYVIEVKPTPEAALQAMERMAIVWDSLPDAHLMVTCPAGGDRWLAWSANPETRFWRINWSDQ